MAKKDLTPRGRSLMGISFNYYIHYTGQGPKSDSFAGKTLVWMLPENPYALGIGANVEAHAGLGYEPASFVTTTTAAVNPIISFDQAAFDALYGSNSFPLEEYYQIDFSPNVTATPLPPTLLLLASGLLVMAGWRRFSKG